MQAELIGFSLAIGPGRAAYVPLAHKSGAGDLLGGGTLENQIPVREALALLKPLLEDKSVLKIAQDAKYDLVVMSRHGIDVAPFDDTMLISYVLDAGTRPPRLVGARRQMARPCDDAAQGPGRLAAEARSASTRSTSTGRPPTPPRHADVALRLWQVLKPRLGGQGPGLGL